jgi:hypothetical protein
MCSLEFHLSSVHQKSVTSNVKYKEIILEIKVKPRNFAEVNFCHQHKCAVD